MAETDCQDEIWSKYVELFHKNFLSIITYGSVFWTFGLCMGFLGPTLWDMECMVELSLSKTTWLFVAQFTFMMLGSVAAGCLLSRYDARFFVLVDVSG